MEHACIGGRSSGNLETIPPFPMDHLRFPFNLCFSFLHLHHRRSHDPPFTTAALAFSASSAALSLALLPFSPSISSLTPSSTSFLPTTAPAAGIRSLIPTPITSATIFALKYCSAIIGHVSKATPADTASSTEFQPQWLTNPPTATWLNTCFCGTHPLSILPKSAEPLGGSHVSDRTAHRNRIPARTSPWATSSSCSSEISA
ncbi:hypothetical protein M5K25_027924 [Dendrobium thyrsiflorum]|uniref:Uncharacterized protein n=1 Tax=Dendrobium thyrsiflorum TaxID=117978 RepID=A0ABD0TV78_DENTH